MTKIQRSLLIAALAAFVSPAGLVAADGYDTALDNSYSKPFVTEEFTVPSHFSDANISTFEGDTEEAIADPTEPSKYAEPVVVKQIADPSIKVEEVKKDEISTVPARLSDKEIENLIQTNRNSRTPDNR